MAELASRRVAADRMRIVINRWHKSDQPAEEICEELNAPLGAVLRNDFPGVRRATVNGDLINLASPLGEAYAIFAKSLIGISEAPKRGGGLLQKLTGRA
jgi:hypothetical protein